MHRIHIFLAIVACTAVACSQSEPPAQVVEDDRARDFFSFANTDQFVTDSLELDLTVDFEAEELHGSAILNLNRIDSGATEIVLDTRDLSVANASVSTNAGAWTDAEFRFGEADDVLGTPLIVTVPTEARTSSSLALKIDYRTSPGATALQWLPKNLTAGGDHPYLFSQSQAIHARSWVPLQDTPAVRITYKALIHTPSDLLAVMSANNDPDAARDGEYEFEMPQRIPSYLLAIAVGNIYFAPIGDQTGVYSEPETLEASAFEFADTQAMLETAEAMFGPYQWGRYDLSNSVCSPRI